MTNGAKYNLEERLLKYSARIVLLTEKLPSVRSANHIASQLLRSGTSSMPNHGEAQAAESQADFIHKLKVCLKELRETYRWLRLIDYLKYGNADETHDLMDETDQLIRIFVKSVRTAEERQNGKK